ncbi:MAG: ADP-glyceromanno-heptose 6-epimerase [Deltaproteobacteria bacterium]|jgi:ADP-L-glycero-D-manno-heptose 6-epimerase|nr:ADP-glyceromanno-heptose 6-epimerase [Deltaproteobacteria bacterium]
MYIITGGAGFIGSALVRRLNELGIADILVVDNLASTEKWKNLVKAGYLAYMHRDDFLRHISEDSLEEALSINKKGGASLKIKGIAHLGACSSTTECDADYLMRNNLEYSKTLCDYALRRGIRYLQASSAATYGDGAQGFDDDPARLRELRPLNMYGYSKHLFDLWAADTGRLDSIASIKFFNVYGPGEYHKGDMRSMIHKAVEQIKATGKVRLFKSYLPDYADGGQLRDFVYVKDCAAVLADLLKRPEINGVFNLGAGAARSWNDLAQAVFAAMELEPHIEYIEMPEALRGKYQYYTKAEMGRLTDAFAAAKAGGQPLALRSLEEGVTDYVRNYLLKDDQYI